MLNDHDDDRVTSWGVPTGKVRHCPETQQKLAIRDKSDSGRTRNEGGTMTGEDEEQTGW